MILATTPTDRTALEEDRIARKAREDQAFWTVVDFYTHNPIPDDNLPRAWADNTSQEAKIDTLTHDIREAGIVGLVDIQSGGAEPTAQAIREMGEPKPDVIAVPREGAAINMAPHNPDHLERIISLLNSGKALRLVDGLCETGEVVEVRLLNRLMSQGKVRTEVRRGHVYAVSLV